MVTESAVVVVLTLVISYLYMRRGKQGIAASILPLAVLPTICLMGFFLRQRLPSTIMTTEQWGILLVMIGLLVGGSLFGIISSNIRKKSARNAYLLVCGGFTVLFAFAEILSIMSVL